MQGAVTSGRGALHDFFQSGATHGSLFKRTIMSLQPLLQQRHYNATTTSMSLQHRYNVTTTSLQRHYNVLCHDNVTTTSLQCHSSRHYNVTSLQRQYNITTAAFAAWSHNVTTMSLQPLLQHGHNNVTTAAFAACRCNVTTMSLQRLLERLKKSRKNTEHMDSAEKSLV